MPNKTHRALPRYKISEFFRSLLGVPRRPWKIVVADGMRTYSPRMPIIRLRCLSRENAFASSDAKVNLSMILEEASID
jgi:hypothetical protein